MTNGNTAVFSSCRKYRYLLSRVFDDNNLRRIIFIGLNPSTATAEIDDPTIRRVMSFAKKWGYGSVHMMNLFGYITPHPEELTTVADPLGDNDKFLKLYVTAQVDVLFSWGTFETNGRDKVIIKMFPDALCLGKNQNGSPKHPLYLQSGTKPIKFNHVDHNEIAVQYSKG